MNHRNSISLNINVQNLELCHSFDFWLERYCFNIVPTLQCMVLVMDWKLEEEGDEVKEGDIVYIEWYRVSMITKMIYFNYFAGMVQDLKPCSRHRQYLLPILHLFPFSTPIHHCHHVLKHRHDTLKLQLGSRFWTLVWKTQ